jgi:hypothetical protein
VRDHLASFRVLSVVADSLGSPITNILNAKDQASFDRLTTLNGVALDRAFSNFMITDHQNEIASFTTESNDITADADLRAFAISGIPLLQTHLRLAKAMRTSVVNTEGSGTIAGTAATATTAPTTTVLISGGSAVGVSAASVGVSGASVGASGASVGVSGAAVGASGSAVGVSGAAVGVSGGGTGTTAVVV